MRAAAILRRKQQQQQQEQRCRRRRCCRRRRLRDGAGQRRPRLRASRRLPPAPRRSTRWPRAPRRLRRSALGRRHRAARARHPHAARHHHAGLQARGGRDGGGGLAGHGGLVHRVAAGAEGDRDQPGAAGHHGGGRGRLRLLAAPAGPPVPRLPAAQQGARLGGRRLQAAGQHGVPVQGHGAQHGHHDLRLGQEGARPVLRGQRGHARAGPRLRGGLGLLLRLRGAGRGAARGAGPQRRRRPGAPRHLPGRPPRRLLGGSRHRLPGGAGGLAPPLHAQPGRAAGALRRPRDVKVTKKPGKKNPDFGQNRAAASGGFSSVGSRVNGEGGEGGAAHARALTQRVAARACASPRRRGAAHAPAE